MKLHEMQFRGSDAFGSGEFGASRGSRSHNGIDLAVVPNTPVQATVSGVVTKVGFPYGDDLNYRYVEITNSEYRFRIFYVRPQVKGGEHVSASTIIGTSQNLNKRYRGITEHVHLEIMKDGNYYIDPTPVILALKSV